MGKLDFSISLKLLSENFKKGINNVKSQLNSLKGWIASAFAVGSILDFTKSIASVGSAFQDQMARVKAVSGATKKEFEEMRKEAEKLGATTKYSATQAAEALENLVRNGLSAKDATKSLAKVLELAGSQAIDLAQAADIATAVMNGFGKSVEDLGRVNDILASTTANSATNVTDLSEALKNVAPIANLLGASMEEVCAAIGTLADVGIKGSQAGNALRGILNRLIKPTKQGQEALDRYGISISEAEIKANGLTATLEKLSKVNMSLADQKALFGEEYGSTGAALTSNIEKYTTKKTTIENSSGEAGRQFNEGQGEFKTALDTLKSTWESFLNGIFDKTKGLFTGLINKATSFINILKDFPYLLTAIGFTVGKTINTLKEVIKSTLTEGIVEKVSDKLAREMTASFDILDIAIRDIDFGTLFNTANYDPIDLGNIFEGISEVFSEQEQIILNSLDNVDKETKKKLEKTLDHIAKYKENFIKAKIEVDKIAESKNKLSNLNPGTDEYKELTKEIENAEKALDKYKKKLEDISKEVSKETLLGEDFYSDPMKFYGTTETEQKAEKGKKKIDKFLDDLKNKAVSVFGVIGKSVKSVYNFFGGWVGILTTVGSALVGFYRNWKAEQDKVFNEIKEEQKKIADQYSIMETKIMSLIGVMRNYSTETTAWKAARDKLNESYPDLLKNLNLEKASVDASGDAYERLERRIKAVIAQQKLYMINEHKRSAIQKLQEDFISKTNSKGIFGVSPSLTEGITDSFSTGKHKNGSPILKEAATILTAQLRDDILSMLSENDENGKSKYGIDDIEKYIREVFDKYQVSSRYEVAGGERGIAETFYNIFQRYRKEIESINSLDAGSEVHPEKLIYEFVELALEEFKGESELRRAVGKAKNESEDEINSAIENIRETVLNKLIEDLKGISTKIDNKSALEYAKSLNLYDELLSNKPGKGKNGKGGTTTTTTTTEETTTIIGGSKDSKTPKQIFDETKAYLDALKEAKPQIIDENEYRKRLLSAYDSYINSLEDERKTDKESIDTIRELNKQRDELKKQIEETEKAEAHWKEITDLHSKVKEELIEKDRERLDKADDIREKGLKAKDRYDNYPKYNELNGVFASDLLEGSVLAPLEHDLQRLYDYLDDLQSIHSLEEINDQLEQIEKLKGDGVKALREQLNRLKKEIEDAELAATDLNEKIQLRRAKKEIQDMTDEVGLMGYETVKGVFTTYDSLIRNLNEIGEKWDEMDFGEQMIQGIFGTIDAMISLAQMIKGLQEAWELLSFKKKVLAKVEEGDTAKKIALTQAEAAATVAAETEKTAAITGALTAQTSAALAAKAAQTKAATVAMAAESTAAYAGIPFAGVGLAAAQIAEMEALIAAAAALPMFAEGGIVGGSKYIGDQNLARVNSGEMIINGSQQRKLWDAISNNRLGGNTLSGDVEFKISGQVLRGVLNNHDKKMSKIKG